MVDLEKMIQQRKRNNLTQKDVGDLLGVSEKTVSAMERGERSIPLHRAVLIAQLYGVSVESLFFTNIVSEKENNKVKNEGIR